MARRERVDLGERGFYATPGVDYNRETGRGNPFFYLHHRRRGGRGDHRSLHRRADLRPGRPADGHRPVDQPGRSTAGQVIGGFIQGVGWVTDEELKYDATGALLSTGPTTYKIPNITDLPRVLNVDFIDNPKHQKNVRQSKAVGEPPLMLGVAVWMAAKHALSFIGDGDTTALAIPATSEELLMRMTAMQQAEAAVAAD